MKPQLIIIEGPDRSGKSTLAKFISRKRGGVYMHASGDKSLHTGMQAYHESILETAKRALDNNLYVVIDRLWPSESVYGELLRASHPGHVAYRVDRMRGLCMGLKARYIFCSTKDAIKRHQEDPDKTHHYSDAEFAEIVKGYGYLTGLLMSSDREPTITYDLNEQGSDLDKYMQENGL